MAEPMPDTRKRQLRNLLINPRLQFRYALAVTAFSAAICVILGVVIWKQSALASDQIQQSFELAGAGWLDPETRAQVQSQVAAADVHFVVTLVAWGLALALGLFAVLVLMTHRVAGPLHRIAQYFEELAAGAWPTIAAVRRGDQFGALFATLQTTRNSLFTRACEDIATVDAFLAACDRIKGGAAEPLASVLAELRHNHETCKTGFPQSPSAGG